MLLLLAIEVGSLRGLQRLGRSISRSRDPERRQAAGDGGCRKRPEIAAVQAVADRPVHQEDFALGDEPAALPDRQRPAEMIAVVNSTGITNVGVPFGTRTNTIAC